MLGLLASPRTGLLSFAPFAWLAPWGLFRSRRAGGPSPLGEDGLRGPFGELAALARLALGLTVLALALYGGWFDWPASLAYGPRFLVPILAPLALAFGLAADALPRRARWLACAAVALGFAVQLPGALVMHARIAEPDALWHPTVVGAWRALLAGDPVGEGVDCASTYVSVYPALALAAALAGLAASSTRLRPSRAPG
jgi:hypothetical protein